MLRPKNGSREGGKVLPRCKLRNLNNTARSSKKYGEADHSSTPRHWACQCSTTWHSRSWRLWQGSEKVEGSISMRRRVISEPQILSSWVYFAGPLHPWRWLKARISLRLCHFRDRTPRAITSIVQMRKVATLYPVENSGSILPYVGMKVWYYWYSCACRAIGREKKREGGRASRKGLDFSPIFKRE